MPARREGVLPQQTLNTIFEKLGGVEASVREAKHAANNAGQKIDAVAGKVDALALVVATQGQIRDHVDRLEKRSDEQEQKLEALEADKHRRDGAIGLVEWISKNYPFLVMCAGIFLWVGYANGLFKWR
jgi:chromosome segregation ATPase